MATNKKTKKPSTAVVERAKKGPGRPRKNVIGGKKTTKGPGRPRKNVILTKEERLKRDAKKTSNKKTVKKVAKKPVVKKTISKKNTTKKIVKKPVTKKVTKKPGVKPAASAAGKKKAFTHHNIDKNKLKNNFAIWLLIFSFLLFSFSVYKAFFAENRTNTSINTDANITTDITTDEKTIETTKTKKIISIESYEDLMGIETSTGSEIEEEIEEETQEIQQVIIPAHTFTRVFNKEEQSDEITILQKFLYSQMLYTGEFNGINDAQTRESIYTFQLKQNILTAEDPINLHGYFGPSTRANINAMMPQQ